MAENLYSMSEDLAREQREQQEDLRLRIANQLQHDPEEARRILSVQGVTGLPEEVVASSLDELEKKGCS